MLRTAYKISLACQGSDQPPRPDGTAKSLRFWTGFLTKASCRVRYVRSKWTTTEGKSSRASSQMPHGALLARLLATTWAGYRIQSVNNRTSPPHGYQTSSRFITHPGVSGYRYFGGQSIRKCLYTISRTPRATTVCEPRGFPRTVQNRVRDRVLTLNQHKQRSITAIWTLRSGH